MGKCFVWVNAHFVHIVYSALKSDVAHGYMRDIIKKGAIGM